MSDASYTYEPGQEVEVLYQDEWHGEMWFVSTTPGGDIILTDNEGDAYGMSADEVRPAS